MGLENPLHLAIIALVVLLLFGAKRLPELGRSLGSGIREFKGSVTGEHDDDDEPKPAVIVASAPPVASAPVETPAAKAETPSAADQESSIGLT